MRVPQGPGLGIDPDPAMIARYRTHTSMPANESFK